MTIKGDVVIHHQKLCAQQSRTESCKPYATGDWLAAFVANDRAAKTKLEVLGKYAKYYTNDQGKDKGGLHWSYGFKAKLFKHINSAFFG